MKSKYKITFERFGFNNRWKQDDFDKNCNWVIFGVQEYWIGPESFCYKICLFGFDLHIWFDRKFL